ncbi:MAG TPA: ferritin-like domain-containing protein [Kofleriaceae bacterium]|nr:ferritin-like domain-containing protein [Kofleriaceae bacterium]
MLATLPACVGTALPGSGDDTECERTVSHEFDVDLPSDPPLDLRVESCRMDADVCKAVCDLLVSRAGFPGGTCVVTFSADSAHAATSYTERIDSPYCNQGSASEGRRPAGLVQPRCIEASSAIGAWLAEAAWLEAASIPAFIYLARELDMHGAPRGLARLALAAARDEIRHARMMNAMAARFGGKPPMANVDAPKPRSLEDMAIENAVEGCVRETWGAIVAMWQAERARDRELRAAFRSISKDEARHSALAWAVDSWLSTRLDAAAQKRVADARHHAVRELFEGEHSEVHAMLGLPIGADARALVSRAEQTLWQGGLS